MKLGSQKELIESARSTISGDMLAAPIAGLSSRMLAAANEVSACSYEASTCWGQEVCSTIFTKYFFRPTVYYGFADFCRFCSLLDSILQIGWVYGSTTEDILTGQRIHAAGWKSALPNTNPPAFLGSAPTGGPASLTQYKRWATGLFEILLSRNNPILLSICKRLQFRQCLAYLVIDVWPLRAPFELCYSLLGPYCLLTNHSFLPKVNASCF